MRQRLPNRGHSICVLHRDRPSRNVSCVNVDAVIAALLPALLWKDFTSGRLTERSVNGGVQCHSVRRMIGAAAEIEDHLKRGRNMNTRAPILSCAFVV
jgi:hypothetical protein